jgi:Zn-finger nucleic acid-binding protein
MAIFELEGVEIDRCLRCGGTWLDGGELDHLLRLAGASPGTLSKALEKGAGKKIGDRPCPRCSGKLRVAAVQGVEIDLCPRGDGLWFDRSEMNLVIDSFREGEAGAAARFFGDFFAADRRKEN